MIPLYDTVRSRRFPFINVLLVIVNVLVFVYELQLSRSGLKQFVFAWGFIPAQFWSDPSSAWLNIFTAMFLHGGWLHIISNMWVLLLFGDNIEERMGSLRYLIFYLLSGAAAALLQAYVLQNSDQPMIGASGAIAGVLGAYLILFPHSRIASLVPIFFIFTIVEIPAVLFLLFWFGMQIYSGLFSAQGSGIAWWAHVGGFIFGVLMVSFFAVRRRTVYSDWQ
jgi:membrane associated rhomboid family serine protease